MQIEEIKGTIKLESGLHIGGGDDTMKIGGIDNQVIKDTNRGEPYIPGSSLKGKMRSLLEWHFGLVGFSDGNPFSPKYMKSPFPKEKYEIATNLLKLFGCSLTKDDEKIIEELNLNLGITRINVGDCFITDKTKEEYENGNIKLSEAKYENVIDRSNGTAKHPRQTERVPAGVEFDFSIRYKVLDGDSEEEFKKIIEKGLELIEKDYLGGNGSRGYGRVKFNIERE